MAGLRQLRYFVAVAHRLHFTRAAEELLIAQPALSQSIRHLERELDVVLFDRTTRGVALTPAGEVLLRGAERALAEVDRALADVRSYAGIVTGRVRVGAWQSMDVRLPDLLSAFRAAHPAVDVVISEVVSDAMIDGVRTGSLDFAFVVRREQARTSGLGHEEFLTEPYALAVSRSHALARRRRVRLTELVEEPFILHRPGSAVRELILDACAEAGYRPRIALETGEISAARAFVASGLGITILPRSSLLSAGPKVHIIDIGPPNLTRTSDMTWSRTRPLSTAATAFRDFARSHKQLLR